MTVQISRIFQLLGQSLEELAEDEDHQTGTNAVAYRPPAGRYTAVIRFTVSC